MKLQITLLIATAICFNMLLCSQATDSHKNSSSWTVCKPMDGTCSDENHKCAVFWHFNVPRGYCVQLTDEDANALPECDINYNCEDSKTCYEIFLITKPAIFRCMDRVDV